MASDTQLTNDARYVLFSIGNLKPLFESAFSDCWKAEKTCNATWIAAVEYLEICGIIVGQILVGILGDWYDHGSVNQSGGLTVPGLAGDGV